MNGTLMIALLAGLFATCAQADDWLVVKLGARDAARWETRVSASAPDLSDDACRTSELWLRRIQGGQTFAGAFEVTQRQYALVTGEDPARHKGATRPVESVSYADARGEFLSVLSAKTGLAFDLPTEAEWMTACMAGCRQGAFHNGKFARSHEEHDLDGIARYGNNRHDGKGGGFEQHVVVGSYGPNAWGLHDFHGNVSEMCLDKMKSGCLKLKGGNWYPCMEISTAFSCACGDAGCGGWLYADEDYASDLVGFRAFAKEAAK